MKKKRLLLLGGGHEQVIAVQIARELGAEVIVFDGEADPACKTVADEFYQLNIKDEGELFEQCRELRLDAVFVHAAELAVPCARVAERFHLPGISVEAAIRGTDKATRIECLRAAGSAVGQAASRKARSIARLLSIDTSRSIESPPVTSKTLSLWLWL